MPENLSFWSLLLSVSGIVKAVKGVENDFSAVCCQSWSDRQLSSHHQPGLSEPGPGRLGLGVYTIV